MRHKNIWIIGVLLAMSLLTACGNTESAGTDMPGSEDTAQEASILTDNGNETPQEPETEPTETEADRSGGDEAMASDEEQILAVYERMQQAMVDKDTDTLREMMGADTETEGNGSNILVAYFSLAGEQYGVGVIEEGNTSIIAHMIAEQTGADLFEIEPVTPYPESHSELLAVSQEEMSENARPEIAGTVENMEDYNTVFIGYPNWWDTLPMPVVTFLERLDWTGKRIIPFCTNEGSGLGQSKAAIRSACTGAEVTEGASFRGHKVKKLEKQIAEWAKKCCKPMRS